MTDPIPFETFYDLRQPTELSLSPDGEYAAFVADEFDPDEDERLSSVFVVPTDGSREPHRLTRAASAGSPTWSPDGSKLAVSASRDEDLALRTGRESDAGDDESGAESDGDAESDDDHPGEKPRSQVWVFDLDLGGDPRQATAFDEGVREFDWAPDGERLVVAARDPTEEQTEYLRQRREDDGPIETERLQHKADGVGWLDDVRTYLFVVDLDDRETTRLDDAYGAGAREPLAGLQPTWSPDGDRIAFVTNRTERPDDSSVMDVYTIAPDGSDLRQVTDGDLSAGSPEWAPNGDRLAFVASPATNNYVPSEVYVADLDADRYESVSASLDRTAVGYRGLRWLDGDRIVGCIGDEGLTRPVVFDADTDAPERAFPVQGRDRELALFDCRGGTVVAGLSDPEDGPDLYAASETVLSEDGELTRLTDLNGELLDEIETPRSRRISYGNGDGDEIEAVAYLPDGFDPNEPEPRGLILSIHGGPMSYDAPEFGFQTACWTSRGYLVVQPNYRGSTSYGRDFCESLRGRWGTHEATDQAACVETLIERGWVDPDRTFSTGFSYGGISTGYLITQTDLFTAAAAEHGLYDMRSAFGTDDSHLWWDDEYGMPWEEPETYDEISSITDVGNVETPLLVTAGGEDWRCPPTQSEQLYVSVRKQGVPAKLVVYQDEYHNVGDPDRAIHRLEELTSWFERFDPAVESEDGKDDEDDGA